MSAMARVRTGSVTTGVLVLPGTDRTLDVAIQTGRVMATDGTF